MRDLSVNRPHTPDVQIYTDTGTPHPRVSLSTLMRVPDILPLHIQVIHLHTSSVCLWLHKVGVFALQDYYIEGGLPNLGMLELQIVLSLHTYFFSLQITQFTLTDMNVYNDSFACARC